MGASIVDRARRFFVRDLWRSELQPRSLTAAALRLLQLGVMIVEGFVRDQLLLRASALTYMAVLAVIPALAVVGAVIRALGVGENLVSMAVAQFTAGNPEARDAILPLVENVDLGGFGTVGASLLFVTTVLALRHGEHALNEIWGVVQGRSWTRRFTDYLAVLIVAPVSLALALSLGTTLQSDPVVGWLLQFPAFEFLYRTGLRHAPLVLYVVAFSFVYWFLPNTDVRLRSALLGGVIAAVLFVVAQGLYYQLNVGAARYDAFFGALSALPFLLVWIYVSMAVFLLGAEISFAHQNLARYRQEIQAEPPGAAEREVIGLCVALEVARAFRDCDPPWTAGALADRFSVSVRTVRELLAHLANARIIAPAGTAEREGFVQLGRPAEDVRIVDVLSAIRGDATLPDPESGGEASVRAVAQLVGDLQRSVSQVAGAHTLAGLLEGLPRRS